MTAPATDPGAPGVELGVYEKALAWNGDWGELFGSARRAGYSFVDLSVDESPERLARLVWTDRQRREVRQAAQRAGVGLGALCLSAHRLIAPGSADDATHRKALEILVQGIDLCRDLDIPVLQVAGYFAFYEPAHPAARRRYVDVLRAGAAHAARCGIMLGIENVDGVDITSISAALQIVDEIDSAWLRLYPDIGNLAERGQDVVGELAAGSGHMLAVHVKDVLPGQPRRVAMGTGAVPWHAAFAELARQRWSGRLLVEMWNDNAPDSETLAASARAFIVEQLTRAGITVHAAPLATTATTQ